MKRNHIMVLMMFLVVVMAGCQQKETNGKTESNAVLLYVNDVPVKGKHTVDTDGNVQVDTTKEKWLSEEFTEEKTVSADDLARRYHLVKENREEGTNTYRMVLLPKGFEYATPEHEGEQSWVNAALYPKGWYVVVRGDGFASMFAEVIPLEDYELETDKDGFPVNTWNDNLLDGLPLPPVKRIEIIDFPNGHADMEDEPHYSIELKFH